MKKIIFVLLAIFALSASVKATSLDPFEDVQFSITQPYYLSFTGTFSGSNVDGCNFGSIAIVGQIGDNYWGTHFQECIFSTVDETLDGWYTNINNGFDLEPYINKGYTDFTIYFDSNIWGTSTYNKQIYIHVDGNKNITYTWNFEY